jgi:hypothetical protein
MESFIFIDFLELRLMFALELQTGRFAPRPAASPPNKGGYGWLRRTCPLEFLFVRELKQISFDYVNGKVNLFIRQVFWHGSARNW